MQGFSGFLTVTRVSAAIPVTIVQEDGASIRGAISDNRKIGWASVIVSVQETRIPEISVQERY